jgi:enamine deaminase RidA (YjgF/YER057c/UK114 family)
MNLARLMPTPIMHRVVAANGTLSIGGIIADDKTLPMAGQTTQVQKKLEAILEASGSSIGRLISTTIYITRMELKSEMVR